MKRMVSILVAILFLLIFPLSVFANSKTLMNEIKINEWENYKKISSMNDNELLSKGYSEAQISKIRSFNYEEEIRFRANLPDEKLVLYGYTKEEIDELRAAAALKEIPESVMKSISTSTMTSSLKYLRNIVF